MIVHVCDIKYFAKFTRERKLEAGFAVVNPMTY